MAIPPWPTDLCHLSMYDIDYRVHVFISKLEDWIEWAWRQADAIRVGSTSGVARGSCSLGGVGKSGLARLGQSATPKGPKTETETTTAIDNDGNDSTVK